MYEVSAVICDEYGTRCVSAAATFLETSAYDKMAELKKMYPENEYFVEYVPAQDEWNAYW